MLMISVGVEIITWLRSVCVLVTWLRFVCGVVLVVHFVFVFQDQDSISDTQMRVHTTRRRRVAVHISTIFIGWGLLASLSVCVI